AAFEPEALREQVAASWAREQTVETSEEVLALLADQLPFHFGDPLDPRIRQFAAELGNGVYSPEVLRHFATAGYGGIEVTDELPGVRHPVLVLAGRLDRTCSPAAAEAIATGIPGAELTIFEESGHMTFVESNAAYLRAVGDFLGRHGAIFSENAASFAHHP
ncbi:MAG: hypothetical protein QOG68_823, partial [Solirubrobacteraceae bacterium]|nr:hypothetical protein [Solirubrobacteraceae bacterium]